jgi:hypothetical protein
MEMKHRLFFDPHHKEVPSLIDETKTEAILELDKLESMFIRLRNLSILGKERTKISDREKRAKMEGYVQAFAHAADLVNKERKKLEANKKRNAKARSDEPLKPIPSINRMR